MASTLKTEIAIDSHPKPQNQTTRDSKTPSSPQPTSDSKSLTLPSASFSKPLEGANSTVSSHPTVKNVGLRGKLEMSHQEASATFTAKATEAQKQQLQRKSAKSSPRVPPSKQPGSSVPSSSAVVREEKPTLRLKDCVQEGNDKSSSGRASDAADSAPCKPESSIPSSSAVIQEENPTLRLKDCVQEGNDKSSSGRASDAADSAPHKPESSILSSSAIMQEETPTLRLKDCVQKGNDKGSSGYASEAADSASREPVSLQLAREKVDKHNGKQGRSNHTDDHGKDIPRTPKPDGYSWRKYGQKQVKNSGSSCSYYRCTYSDCYAKKKVQHLDVSGRIIGVIYRGEHNHDPPQDLKGSNKKREMISAAEVSDPGRALAQKYDDSHVLTLTLRKEVEQAVPPLTHGCRQSNLNSSASVSLGCAGAEHSKTPDPFPTLRLKSEAVTLPTEAEHFKSSTSDEVSRTDPVKECDVLLKKRRIQESGKACAEPVCRAFKESEVVMHAARGAESLSDGYRWRKYGQKTVKGNPNPRSYYRCSSAGCQVRKHVERATHDSTIIIVTYEGIHDHDKPVYSEPVYIKRIPKKCHSRKFPAHVAATTTPVHKLELKSPCPSQAPSALGCSDVDNDVDGDKPAEVGADKVLESARTLLSIGIELKSC